MEYVGEDRRTPDNHTTPCPLLQEHIDIAKAIRLDLASIKKNQQETIELLTVFATTKGFIKGLQILGEVVKWFSLVTGGVIALYLFLKR